MNLIIDAGNTRVKMAIFSKGKMLHFLSLDTLNVKKIQEFIKDFKIESAILSSVATEDQSIISFLKEHFFLVCLSGKTPLPITNAYQSPETLGSDRIACAVGAHGLFPGRDVLSIDAGTCIKYDMVTAKGVYLGGAISPGLLMRISSMHNFTARLPLLPLAMPDRFIGNTTESSMLSGAVYGAITEVDGCIKRYRETYKQLKVVLSGGDMAYFENSLKSRIFAAPNLVMQGLNLILVNHAKI